MLSMLTLLSPRIYRASGPRQALDRILESSKDRALDSSLSSDLSAPSLGRKQRADLLQAQANPIVIWSPGISLTDEEFASQLCAQLSSAATSLTINGPIAKVYPLPSCVAGDGFNLKKIVLVGLSIQTFGSLPPSTTDLSLQKCRFSPAGASPSTSTNGFKDTGEIDWTEVFAILPALTAFQVSNSDSFIGTLPTTLPRNITFFSLITTPNITGLIPSTIFNNGPPPGLSLQFTVVSSGVMGYIPSDLFIPFTSARLVVFNFQLTSNRIEGYISPTLFPSGFLANTGKPTFNFLIADNDIIGSIPPSLFANINYFEKFNFAANRNRQLTGPLPPLFANGFIPASENSSLSVTLSQCTIDGSIPSNFITNGLSANTLIGPLSVDLASNFLTGAIPSDLMQTGAVTFKSQNIFLRFAGNQLTGSIPPQLIDGVAPVALSPSFSLDLTNNRIEGPLPSLSNCLPATPLVLTLDGNRINGSIPNDWQNCNFQTITLANNGGLNGTIPAELLNRSLGTFHASHTSLSGNIPKLSSTLTNLDLSYTKIDFCTAPSITSADGWSAPNCNLLETSACGCTAYYPNACIAACSMWPIAPIPPFPTPTAPIAPAPIPPSVTCTGTPPSPTFVCIGGVWTAIGSVETPILNIPSGAGTVVVSNISSNSIVLNGLNASIEITGCATNLTSLTITLTETQAGEIGKSELIKLLLSSSSANCSVDLNSIDLSTTISGSSCKKVSVKKVTSDDGSTLSGIFTLDNSSCKTWWIILVSVVCGVIVLIVLALILMAIFWPAFRAKVRPYNKARKDHNNVANEQNT